MPCACTTSSASHPIPARGRIPPAAASACCATRRRISISCTEIGGTDALLIHTAGETKWGLAPYLTPVNAKCLRTLEMPPLAGIDGDLSPYPMWRNVHPLVAESARRRNRAIGLGGAAEAWFQTVDRESFPFREFYSERLNSFIAPLVARIGEDPRSQWLVVLLYTSIAAV